MDKNLNKTQRYQNYKQMEQAEPSKEWTIQFPRYTLDKDVIHSKKSKLHLDEALVKIKFYKTIYQDWGFSKVDPAGKGIILNFYGKSGTGKTLTAEALAGTLKMPFLAIGIADLESKFMGETSKNIQAIFKFAIEHQALLFFDEADTLLGKRLSSVTQGVDNEVNAMRSTLLIELENYEGIVVFATNFSENYDKAFESRITHHVYFELPDLEARQAIWNRMIVEDIPLGEDRDLLLSTVSKESEGLSGRDIRTCMRLALPKCLLESQTNQTEPQLKSEHLIDSIQQVKKAHHDVGQEVNTRKMSDDEKKLTSTLLGINKS